MELMCYDLDQCIISIRECFTPIQMAKFLKFDETYRYREELQFHERTWDRINRKNQGDPAEREEEEEEEMGLGGMGDWNEE